MGGLIHHFFIASPILLAIASLACLLLVALPGSRTGFEFTAFDTSKVEVKVRNDVFHGLPDSYDYSKHKDFYKVFLWSYCSGKIRDGVHQVETKSSKLEDNPVYEPFRVEHPDKSDFGRGQEPKPSKEQPREQSPYH